MNSKNKKNFAYQMRQKQEKIRNKFMKDGVTLVAPETIFLSSNIRFGKNVGLKYFLDKISIVCINLIFLLSVMFFKVKQIV